MPYVKAEQVVPPDAEIWNDVISANGESKSSRRSKSARKALRRQRRAQQAEVIGAGMVSGNSSQKVYEERTSSEQHDSLKDVSTAKGSDFHNATILPEILVFPHVSQSLVDGVEQSGDVENQAVEVLIRPIVTSEGNKSKLSKSAKRRLRRKHARARKQSQKRSETPVPTSKIPRPILEVQQSPVIPLTQSKAVANNNPESAWKNRNERDRQEVGKPSLWGEYEGLIEIYRSRRHDDIAYGVSSLHKKVNIRSVKQQGTKQNPKGKSTQS